jgi:hypothetical protein
MDDRATSLVDSILNDKPLPLMPTPEVQQSSTSSTQQPTQAIPMGALDDKRQATIQQSKQALLKLLGNIGLIGASITAVMYVVLALVLIFGVKKIDDGNTMQYLSFVIVTASVGMLINFMLRLQGVTYAKNIPENARILREYYDSKTRDKKYKSIKYFWIKSFVTDVVVKFATTCASVFGVIYIAIVGSGDISLMLIALCNLLMFTCFGLLSLCSAYAFFNDHHIPYIKEQLRLYYLYQQGGDTNE